MRVSSLSLISCQKQLLVRIVLFYSLITVSTFGNPVQPIRWSRLNIFNRSKNGINHLHEIHVNTCRFGLFPHDPQLAPNLRIVR